MPRSKRRRKHKKPGDPGPVQIILCPYCGQAARWVNNEEFYGKRYGQSWKAYWCQPCDARVGCHQNTRRPLGTLANAETRKARMAAHAVFDPMWTSGRVARSKLYADIAADLGHEVHIGESTIEQCNEIIAWCQSRN